MAGKTLQQLQTMIRRRLGWPAADSFVSDAELKDMIRESQRELHDFLSVTLGDEYRVITQTIATSAGVAGYLLPSATKIHRVATRFSDKSVPFRRYQLQSETVDSTSTAWTEGLDYSYRINRTGDYQYGTTTMYVHPIPSAAYVVRVVYTLPPNTLSLSTAVNDIGYDDALVLDVMIKLRQMEELDASDLIAKLEAYKARIQSDAPVDMGQPTVINDARSAGPPRGGYY